jgi:hypothetical protein
VQFGYCLNYLIETENAVIVDVEATPARTYDEVRATKTMLNRTKRRLGLKPKRLAGRSLRKPQHGRRAPPCGRLWRWTRVLGLRDSFNQCLTRVPVFSI